MTFFVTWLESLYSKSPRLAQTQYAGFGNHFKCHSGLLRAFHSVYGQTRVVLVRWGTFATTPLVNLRFAQTLSPDLMISTRKIFLISFSMKRVELKAAEQYSFFPCPVFDVRMENGVDLQQTPTDDHPPQLQELPFSLPPYPQMIMDAIEATNGCNKTAIVKHIDSTQITLPPSHLTLLNYHLNWMKQSGQIVIVKNNYMKPNPNAPPNRGRGRPPKPKPEGDSSHVAVVPAPTPRPRGRPSKSKDS
ncbi:BnaC02g34030D [Brassica napus]|uniref:BnaC02g34030D protein n=1 Tax=Brassica napus TaxID=3708 RepID=A0A078IFL0_BRANA|nr:BnaC02g34030D [Brassica napus]